MLLFLVIIFNIITGRIAAKRQTAGIKFTHKPKIRVFARRGDSLHRFRSTLAGTTGTWVRLAVQNFTSIATGGGNAAPKYQKFPPFLKILGDFIRVSMVY